MSVVSYLKNINATIESVEEAYVEARRGSQLAFRAKGAYFTKKEDYPVVACIRFDKDVQGEGFTARIAVHEDFGPGIITGVKKKYMEACDLLSDQLVEVLKNK